MVARTSNDAVKNDTAETMRTLVFGEARWQVRLGWEPVLFSVEGFRLDGWLASGAATLIRDRGRRAVYCVETGGQGGPTGRGEGAKRFYVKHARCRGWVNVLRNFARGSDARREWENAQEALRRGVPTAVPIAWGEETRGGSARDGFFVSEEIADAVPLDRFLTDLDESRPREERPARRRAVAERLARFVAALHEAGVGHGDFHAGNILVQKNRDGPGCPRFFLIDMAAARFGDALSWPASRENLVVLNAQWFDRSTTREQWRFWRAYLRSRPSLSLAALGRADVASDLDLASREHSRRIDRRRDRRALKTNRDFFSIRHHDADAGRAEQAGWAWRAHAVVDLPRAELEKLLDCPEALLWENLDRPVKLGHSSAMVRATLRLADGPQTVSYKRCRPKNRWKAFWVLIRLRGSRAMRGWRLGHAFLARGIATPRPIMVCEPRPPNGAAAAWQDRLAYLATQWIEGAENLHLWAWALSKLPCDERMRYANECAASLGRLVGRMHARQVSHGDLKGSNVLVVDGGNDSDKQSLKTLLIDLDGARIHKRLPRGRQVADLARLVTSVAAHPWAGNSLGRRFWASYAAEFPRGAVSRKTLWRAVAERSKKLVGKKQKRGEVVL